MDTKRATPMVFEKASSDSRSFRSARSGGTRQFNFNPILFLGRPSPLVPINSPEIRKTKLARTAGVYPVEKYFKDVPSESCLLILNMNLQFELNGIEHRTYGYFDMCKPDPELILRRGHQFRLCLTFSRYFCRKRDDIILHFRNLQATQLLCQVQVVKNRYKLEIGPGKWDAVYECFSINEPEAYIWVAAPTDCPVGFWKLEVETKGAERRYIQKGRVAFLFNPWNILDDTYIEGDELKDKVVLSDIGKMYRGSYQSMGERSWKFNQYDHNILEHVISIMARCGQTDPVSWSSPVDVTRAISHMVRGPKGIIETNFTNNFDGGKSPYEWEGSGEIIKKFINSNGVVKYGHCYTLAGLMVTALRVLGIPSRTVTGFRIPVNPDDQLFADMYFDEEGLPAQDVTFQRLWHYTVWAEAWMARKDLGKAYDGWQATYATIGPAPVEAIKSGEIQIPYDTKVFFSAVNAFYCVWKYFSRFERLKLLSRDHKTISMHIMTKDVLNPEDENVFSSYKTREAISERPPARTSKRFKDFIENDSFNYITFKCKAPVQIYYGKPFTINMNYFNNHRENSYFIKVSLSVFVEFYNGKKGERVKREKRTTVLRKQTDGKLTLSIDFDDYGSKTNPEEFLYCMFHGYIDDVDYDFFLEQSIRMRQPELAFRVNRKLQVNRNLLMDITLYNPLQCTLNKCKFYLGEADTQNHLQLEKDVIHAKEKVRAKFLINLAKEGNYDVVAKFISSAFITWTMARLTIPAPPVSPPASISELINVDAGGKSKSMSAPRQPS